MRRIILLVTVALAIWGCAKDFDTELENGKTYDPSGVMTFATKQITRGTPINDVSAMTDMGVFCSATGTTNWASTDLPGKIFNRILTHNSVSGVWEYSGTPERWDPITNDDRYTFFAYSPYETGLFHATNNPIGNGIVVNGSALTAGIPTLTYTVPTDVTRQPDMMIAVPKYNLRYTGYAVSLEMRHSLTCIGFSISGYGEEISGISIEGVSMEGTLAMKEGNIEWTNLGSVTTTDFSASLIYDLGQNYYTATPVMTDIIAGNGYLMMIPQTLTIGAKVVITKSDNSIVEIDLDGQPAWEAGKKITYNISLTSAGVLIVTGITTTPSFTFEGGTQPFDVTSKTLSGDFPTPWITEYSTDGGTTWTNTRPNWLILPTGGGGGASVTTSHTLEAQAFQGVTSNPENALLSGALSVGSETTPYDLSTKGGLTLISTANCYIINAPGYYQFPLVYGNTIKNSLTNSSAYTSTASQPGVALLGAFLRHDNNPILGPHIVTDNGFTPDNAVIVWQDSPGLISSVALTSDNLNLKFQIQQESIAQGNAILAVRDENNVILWSWHIWVTPLVNAIAPAVDRTLNNSNNIPYDLMQYNLGWCTANTVSYYPDSRSVMVRFRQTAATESFVFTVTQENLTTTVITTGGNAPYWQWGRKDPMLPSTGVIGSLADKNYYNSNYSFSKAVTPVTIGISIQNPHTIYPTVYNSISDWCSPGGYFNLWSAQNISSIVNDNPVVKTVYDPSPVGFTVPASNAWSGLSITNTPGSFNAGWPLFIFNSATTFFPAFGIRNNSTGNVSSVGNQGFYWSATPVSTTNGRYLNFSNSSFNTLNGSTTRATGCSIRCAIEW